ncbi:DUF260 domain-containing protein [Cephalotus follicularis]|uniref:DUF260 domain-containing protein n=1 Tax=Cephalotus follicularis TaxID=3775 RepID=A0A1Q3ASJ0_CEPFO|nr:DUF260 domain-containing protein [Cephalotus follicularis]
MSCNGCRVLRKGCSESCMLRPCLQWIDSPEAQGHATVFVAKFFGRAGLMSFISAVPENQRPALFQSLLFEACGRTVNPVNGAVGLLWTGNWQLCQTAVETVLRGGTLRAMPELHNGGVPRQASDEDSEAEVACTDMWNLKDPYSRLSNSRSKRKRLFEEPSKLKSQPNDYLDLCLTPASVNKSSSLSSPIKPKIWRPAGTTNSSMNSEEESVTTTCFDSGSRRLQCGNQGRGDPKLLNLFF